ncbi:MAG: ribbon-helix-helix domain-containing protein [Syntrophus sp. (in: bacteria)]|nr:ribbon-helix-helix domain-containing protein [Syntrophus sp. (in: bacteria)]
MKKKEGIITFKVDDDLLGVIKNIPNRSEFIRAAVMAALDNVCPLCRGTGILTPKQKEHWEIFAEHHTVKTCEDCHELFIECSRKENE